MYLVWGRKIIGIISEVQNEMQALGMEGQRRTEAGASRCKRYWIIYSSISLTRMNQGFEVLAYPGDYTCMCRSLTLNGPSLHCIEGDPQYMINKAMGARSSNVICLRVPISSPDYLICRYKYLTTLKLAGLN